MNSQQLLFVNFIIFVLIILFFTLGRSRTKPPTKLNLKNSAKQPSSSAEKNEVESARPVREVGPEGLPSVKKGLTKAGCVYFVYNSHEWEAYEVLGLKPECSLHEATSQYQHLIKTSDPSSFEFYETAYFSILKSKK